jgi:hypothetical protein
MDQLKKFSPASFIIIIFCFFMPFVSITCSGQKVMSLTGIKLITGAEYKPQNMFDKKDTPEGEMEFKTDFDKEQNIDAQPMALFALLMAVIALILSFIQQKVPALICMIASIMGAAFMLLLKANLDSDIPSDAQMVIDVEYQFWYWFALLLFIVGAMLQWFKYRDDGAVSNISGLPSEQQLS